jgi:hypothetical protein
MNMFGVPKYTANTSQPVVAPTQCSGAGTGLRRNHSCAQRQVLQRPQAEHAGVGMSTRRREKMSANKSEDAQKRKTEVGDLHLGVHPGSLHRAV